MKSCASADPPSLPSGKTLRVWDLPTRVFHWVLAACVAALVITAKTGPIDWHARLGYLALTLLVFRLLWGVLGGHWSRFASFVYAPASLVAYLRGRAPLSHRIGHSPLGALSVFGLLAVLLAQVATGLISDDEIAFTGPLNALVSSAAGLAATSYHRQIGQWLIIGLVVLHVAAVLFYLLRRGDNLIRPMLTGDKTLDGASASDAPSVPASRDDVRSRVLALVLIALSAAATAWLVTLKS